MADATTASVPRPPTKTTDHNNNNKIIQQKNNNPQRGVIYFRPITPADRSIIQTLHEQWFPVDYKSDFFDSLCSERPIHVGGMTSPLYCCVACFRELDEEEFEERVKRRKQREEESRGISSAWSSFWSSSSTQNTVDELDDGDEFDDGDCLLWESDNNSSIASDRITRNNEGSYHEALTATTANSQPQTATTNDTKNDDDALESGESEVSVHHRMEKEKMERFYSNGFRFDADDDHDTSFHNGKNDSSSNISNSDESQRKKCKSDQGPYYNDNGECIIGCIVGSFLPSTMPSTKHRSSLDEKIGRDETATLLIPDSIRYTKMFYIMTLGTTREFRRCGLGSILVNRVVDMVEDREECGALYLHVITYNEGAIRLYERLRFSKVKDIKDYYSINSVNYDCYLYARYFHGESIHV
ncbi:hypothetical protein ACHAXR_013171 [Thalassiosira sp. AJA248-18]